MSKTPETDAIAHRGLCESSYIAQMTDHARQLEVKSNEWKKCAKKLADIIGPPEDETWASDDELKEAWEYFKKLNEN